MFYCFIGKHSAILNFSVQISEHFWVASFTWRKTVRPTHRSRSLAAYLWCEAQGRQGLAKVFLWWTKISNMMKETARFATQDGEMKGHFVLKICCYGCSHVLKGACEVDAHESNLMNIDDGWLRMIRMCGLFSSWNHCDKMLQVWDTVRYQRYVTHDYVILRVYICDILWSVVQHSWMTLLQRGNIRKPRAMESVDHQEFHRGSHWVPSMKGPTFNALRFCLGHPFLHYQTLEGRLKTSVYLRKR